MKNLLMLIKCIIGCINLRVAARIVFILVPIPFWSAGAWAAGTSGTLSFAAGDDDQESLFQLYASTRREEAKIYDTDNADTALKPFTAGGNVNIPTPSGTVTVGSTGGGTPVTGAVAVPIDVSTYQPSLYINYIIAVEGIYPERP